MKISEFQTKDVINVVDGRRLGQISDLELDLVRGVIEAIVVPGYSKFMGLFGGGSDLIIPWKSIGRQKKAGETGETIKSSCSLNEKWGSDWPNMVHS